MMVIDLYHMWLRNGIILFCHRVDTDFMMVLDLYVSGKLNNNLPNEGK